MYTLLPSLKKYISDDKIMLFQPRQQFLSVLSIVFTGSGGSEKSQFVEDERTVQI